MGSIITTDRLCRNFRSGAETVQALKNVSITINNASLTVLRGRSGSGKTTLINLLGALDSPDKGTIVFNGNEISHASEIKRDSLRRKGMGFIFQSVALISLMSAYENVEFVLRVAGYDKGAKKKRAEECLAFVGLQKRMHHRPHELSGGEQQRVAIARAIAHKPLVVFADEPTAELDTHTGLEIMKLFRNLIDKEGLTIVMSTHDPNMMEVADYVYTLEDGEVTDEVSNIRR